MAADTELAVMHLMAREAAPEGAADADNEALIGDVVCFRNYMVVEAADDHTVHLRDLHTGRRHVFHRGDLADARSARRYEQTEHVTRTEAVERLRCADHRPFTVVYDKKDGTERTLVGRLLHREAEFGRSLVEELTVEDPDDRIKQVDHRTVKSLILDGVRYLVKTR